MAENTITIEFRDEPGRENGAGSKSSTDTSPPSSTPARSGSTLSGIPVNTTTSPSSSAPAVPVRIVPNASPATANAGPVAVPTAKRLPSLDTEEVKVSKVLGPGHADGVRDLYEQHRKREKELGDKLEYAETPSPAPSPPRSPASADDGEPALAKRVLSDLEELRKRRAESTAGSSGSPPPPPSPPRSPASADDGDFAEKRGVNADELAVIKRGQKRQADEAEASAKNRAERLKEFNAESDEAYKKKDGFFGNLMNEGAGSKESMDRMRTIASGAQSIASGGKGGAISGGMQIASTGALGAEAAAFAAGPVGALIAAAPALESAAQSVISAPHQAVRAVASQAAEAGTSLAQGDAKAVKDEAVEGLASLAEGAGLAGYALAEQMRTVNALTNAFGAVTDAFVKRGKELSAYDGRLASANAEADVRKLNADIREAKVLGKDYERVTRGSTEMDSASTELMLFLKGELLGALAEIVEPIGEFAKANRPLLRLITDMSGDVKLLATLVRYFPPVLILRIVNWLLRVLGVEEKEQPGLLEDIYIAADALLNSGSNFGDDRSDNLPASPSWEVGNG